MSDAPMVDPYERWRAARGAVQPTGDARPSEQIIAEGRGRYEPDRTYPRIVNGWLLPAESGERDCIVPLHTVLQVRIVKPTPSDDPFPVDSPLCSRWQVIAECQSADYLAYEVRLGIYDTETEAREALAAIYRSRK